MQKRKKNILGLVNLLNLKHVKSKVCMNNSSPFFPWQEMEFFGKSGGSEARRAEWVKRFWIPKNDPENLEGPTVVNFENTIFLFVFLNIEKRPREPKRTHCSEFKKKSILYYFKHRKTTKRTQKGPTGVNFTFFSIFSDIWQYVTHCILTQCQDYVELQKLSPLFGP